MNSFNNQDEIQNQFKMPDNEQAERHKCEICDKDFKTKETLRAHFNHFHNQKQQYICDICHNGNFTNQSRLDSHMKTIHDNKKQYKCDSCKKSFAIAGHLKRHFNSVHNNQRDHKCDSCGKSFALGAVDDRNEIISVFR